MSIGWNLRGPGAAKFMSFAKNQLAHFRRTKTAVNKWYKIQGARIRIYRSPDGLEKAWIWAVPNTGLSLLDGTLGVAVTQQTQVLLAHPLVELVEGGYQVTEDIPDYFSYFVGGTAPSNLIKETIPAGFYTTDEFTTRYLFIELRLLYELSTDDELIAIIKKFIDEGKTKYASVLFFLAAGDIIGGNNEVVLDGDLIDLFSVLFAKVGEDGRYWFGFKGHSIQDLTLNPDHVTLRGVESGFPAKVGYMIFIAVDFEAVIKARAYIEGSNTFGFYLPDFLTLPPGISSADLHRDNEANRTYENNVNPIGSEPTVIHYLHQPALSRWVSTFTEMFPSDGVNDFGALTIVREAPYVNNANTVYEIDSPFFLPSKTRNSVLAAKSRLRDAFFGTSFFQEEEGSTGIPFGVELANATNESIIQALTQEHRRVTTKTLTRFRWNPINKNIIVSAITSDHPNIMSVSGGARMQFADDPVKQFTVTTPLTNGPNQLSIASPSPLKVYGETSLEHIGFVASNADNPKFNFTQQIPWVRVDDQSGALGPVQTFIGSRKITSLTSKYSFLTNILFNNDGVASRLLFSPKYNLSSVIRLPGVVGVGAGVGIEYWIGTTCIYKTEPASSEAIFISIGSGAMSLPQNSLRNELTNATISTFYEEDIPFPGTLSSDEEDRTGLNVQWEIDSTVVEGWDTETRIEGTPDLDGGQQLIFVNETPYGFRTHSDVLRRETTVIMKQSTADLCILVWEWNPATPNDPKATTVIFNSFATDTLIKFFANQGTESNAPLTGVFTVL